MVEERTKNRFAINGWPIAARSVKRLAARACRVAAAAAALLIAAPSPAAVVEPPPEVVRLLDAPPLPKLALGPGHRHGLLVHEHELLPADLLAAPTVSVVGRKVNPNTYGRHAPLAYFGLTLLDVDSGRSTAIATPAGSILGFPIWSPDGSRFAFTATVEAGIELWIGNPLDGRVRRLIGPELNGTLSAPCTWAADGRLLCRLIDGEKRRFPTTSANDLFRLTAPTTMQSLAQQALDPWLVRQLIESQLTLIDVETGLREPVGAPTAIEAVDPAPSGAYLLVSRIVPPYPQFSHVQAPLKTIEVWDRSGNVVKTFPSVGSQPNAPRAMQWHASLPATLVWVERYGDGDRLMRQAAPFGDPPAEVFRSPNGYAGLDWLDGQLDALVSEYDSQRRQRRRWLVSWDGAEPRLLAEDSVDAAFPRFGHPMRSTNGWGKTVIEVHAGGIFVRGSTPGEEGAVSYLDHLDLGSLESTRIWMSDGRTYESVLGLLAADGSALLTRRETRHEPPNYYATRDDGETALTAFVHPAPALSDAQRIPLRYRRHDGLGLSATLYLPVGSDPLEPLPVVLWAYPRVYGEDTESVESGAAAEQFLGFERAFKLFFLLQGYAVLDDVSMPIVGSAATANDTFIEQVVRNAQAALIAAGETGFVEPRRAGVAGHSYGAFMVANLLAHSDLFVAGAALSGAYNRTLTPFGFQTERRSLWEARDTYLAMSPFLYSNVITEPLLLVHGLLDENAGTPPIQSIQFYEAIRHNGGNADILLLPREGHTYRGRDAVLATAATMLEFFDTHLKHGELSPEILRASAAAVVDAPTTLVE